MITKTKRGTVMEVYEKLTKQIDETKYLSAENTYRYRPIMRLFYRHYERLEYWLYKEDVYNELKGNTIYRDYSIEECERDLEVLTEWKSLAKMQDTKNASTIEEFKNKKFRYQMTEYATEIERMTILLEEMEIKTASLEPKLFDRLRISIAKLETFASMDNDSIKELWDDLNDDFKKLNENYQDFLKKFNEPKSEELLQSTLFLEFKSEIIKYLREFIKGYQNNVHQIKKSLSLVDEKLINEFVDRLIVYYKKTPILNNNFDYNELREVSIGKLKNIVKWFMGDNTSISEGEKLMNTTDNIIVKITKYANSLIELHGNMTNRKEEYKHFARLFDQLNSIEECHKYSSLIFGIESTKHFIADSNINTDEIINTYDVAPIEILLSSRTHLRKEKIQIEPIVDKTREKQIALENYRRMQQENKKILSSLIKDKKIILKGEIRLSKVERRYIQVLLGAKTRKETEFGYSYTIKPLEGMCKIISEDGIFVMRNVEIEFEGVES